MKFIGRDTDYAVRALMFMAKALKDSNKRIVTVDDIVKKQDLPERFLRRILQRLAKNNVLTSYKGKDGGFSLVRSPKNIFIIDVINIFQGKVDLTNCFLKGSTCPGTKNCILRKKLGKINSIVNKELHKITIASLL